MGFLQEIYFNSKYIVRKKIFHLLLPVRCLFSSHLFLEEEKIEKEKLVQKTFSVQSIAALPCTLQHHCK